MCRFSPLGRTKGRPEGNCTDIVSDIRHQVNKAVGDE